MKWKEYVYKGTGTGNSSLDFTKWILTHLGRRFPHAGTTIRAVRGRAINSTPSVTSGPAERRTEVPGGELIS